MNSLIEKDLKYIWHPYTQAAIAPAPLLIKSAQGAYLMSESHGKLFDGISSWWVNSHGHCHPHINQAIARQSEILEHVMFANFTHEPAVNLAAKLIEIAPKGLSRVFYSDNGSTAVEIALKMAFQYWQNRGEKRPHIISLSHAYHGDTFGAMAASERSVFTEPFWPLLFNVLKAPSTCVSEVNAEQSEIMISENALGKMAQLFEAHKGQVAAVIIEPMLQGAGGMRIFTTGFLRGIKELCLKYGALLIADEVATGFYRTGERFACFLESVSPDIMCLAKGLTGGYLPLAATLATEDIYAGFLSDSKAKALLHGHSFMANPIACAAALASLELFASGETRENISIIYRAIKSEMKRFENVDMVKHVRSIGAVAIIELKTEASGYLSTMGDNIYHYCLSRGLFIRPLGNVLYFMPPLCTRGEEVTWALNIIYEAIHASKAQL